jgi:hypothetical protein
MMLMVSIGYVFSYLIPTKQKSVSLTVSSSQAFFLAQSGVEFAVRYATDQGWANKPALNGLANMIRNLGRGSFLLDYDEPNDRLISRGQIPNSSERRIVVSSFTSFLMTYFGSASTPVDNGSNNANPTAVTPPGSMQAGDLVLMIGQARANAGALTISAPGGQSWTSETQQNQSNCRLRLFWCRFNGTWSANPSVSMGSAANNTVVMHVFRPSNTSSVWAVDVAQVSGTFTNASTTVTIPGITTITDGALVFAAWASSDDNTWGTLTGTGAWFTPGSAQYRNTSGADASQTHAYRVMATAGATGNVSKTQLTLGPDAGARLIIAFRAV